MPTNTDYVVVGINAMENIYNDSIVPEFDGHFADQVYVEIVPEPATLLLLGFGAVMARRNRLKKKR